VNLQGEWFKGVEHPMREADFQDTSFDSRERMWLKLMGGGGFKAGRKGEEWTTITSRDSPKGSGFDHFKRGPRRGKKGVLEIPVQVGGIFRCLPFPKLPHGGGP